jgi:hypothetical protein
MLALVASLIRGHRRPVASGLSSLSPLICNKKHTVTDFGHRQRALHYNQARAWTWNHQRGFLRPVDIVQLTECLADFDGLFPFGALADMFSYDFQSF